MCYRNYLFVFIIGFLLAITSYGKDLTSCQILSKQNKKTIVMEWPYHNKKEKLNSDYWLTAQQLLQQSTKGIVWVDIRSLQEKTKMPLVKVMDLSFLELMSASFLLDSYVVVIDSEFNQLKLNSAIGDLKKVGFKNIFALYGGVRAWNLISQQKTAVTDEVLAEQFLLGNKTIPWKIITLGLTDKDISTLPEKPFKRFDLSKESIEELARIIEEEQANDKLFISWVLIAPDKNSSYQLKQQLNNYFLSEQVVWLQGGIGNYQDYIKQQHKIIANSGLKLLRPCGLAF